MAGVLESLARGLRQAGGILSPRAGEVLQQENAADDAVRRQIEMVNYQQRIADEREKALAAAVGPALQTGDFRAAARAAAASGAPGGTKLSLDLLNKEEERDVRREASKDRLFQAEQTLLMRQAQLDQNRELALGRLQNDTERLEMDKRYKAGRLEIDNALAQIRAQNAQLQSQMLGLRLSNLEQKHGAEEARQVQQLGLRLENSKLPEMDAVLGNVESAIAKNKDILKWSTGPGTSRPDWTLPTDVALGRQALQKLFNIELKNRSGAAVTLPEFERLKQEYATGVFKTPEQLAGAIKQARDILNKHYRGIVAGFSPRILGIYNDNLKAVGGAPVITPGEEPQQPPQGGVEFQGYVFPSQEALDKYKKAKGL